MLPRVTPSFLSPGNISLFGEVCNYLVTTKMSASILFISFSMSLYFFLFGNKRVFLKKEHATKPLEIGGFQDAYI